MTVENVIALVALVALQAGDAATTIAALRQSGREIWLPMVWLMQHLGTAPALVVGKAFVTAMAVWLAQYEMASLFVVVVPTWWVLAGMAAPYAWLVWRNWKQIKREE